MKKQERKYRDIDHFLEENPGWINIHDQLHEDGATVDVLDWMFNNFSIKEKVDYVSCGRFVIDIGNNYLWPLKVSHWRLPEDFHE